jgi:hypothetical protein
VYRATRSSDPAQTFRMRESDARIDGTDIVGHFSAASSTRFDGANSQLVATIVGFASVNRRCLQVRIAGWFIGCSPVDFAAER